MIRLTIHTSSGPQIHLFKKEIITIGREGSQADLVVNEEALQPIFLNIVHQNGFPIVINLANDPFISLNGHPFGKKLLNHGDVLLVRDTEILFENLTTPEQPAQQSDTPLNSILNVELPFENEVEAFKDDEWHPSSIEQITLSHDDFQPLPTQQQTNEPKVDPKPAHKLKKVSVLAILSLFLIGIAFWGTNYYVSQLKISKDHERMAAVSISDIAMALTHAKLYHLKPGNQNWYDTEFFNSNLKAVIGDQGSFAETIDLHGNFSCCPYTLRTYTNQDLSRFLLIAQPEPHWLQWLLPKSIIMLDSELMDLRTLSDLKALNRLLANYHPLDEANGKEVSRLFKESALFPLSNICINEQCDFTIPSDLCALHEKCSQYIYNSPRYYHLSQPLVQLAKQVSKTRSHREIAAFKNESEVLLTLPFLTVYAKNGKQEALEVKRCINNLCPLDQVLVGYLDFNEKGHVKKTILISDNDPEMKNPQTNDDSANHLHALENPLMTQISSLVIKREKDLSEKLQEIRILLENEIKSHQKHFKEHLNEEVEAFHNLNKQYELKITKAFSELTREQQETTPIDPLQLVKSLGLDNLIDWNEMESDSFKDHQQNLLTQIDYANSFTELNNLIEEYYNRWAMDNKSHSDISQSMETSMRNHLHDRIYYLLLSAEGRLPEEHFTKEERSNLKEILNDETFFQPHEKIFFMNELTAIPSHEK